jgi:hypothetical protein
VRRHTPPALVVLFVWRVLPGYAQADEKSIADMVEVEGGGECLDAAVLVEQVVSWLGRDRADGRLAIRVEAEGEPPAAVSFVVEVEGEPSAERHFHRPPTRCEDVRAAVALAIALAIDATILESLGIGSRDDSSAGEPAPGRAGAMRIAIEGAASAGIVPEPAIGGAAAWEVAWGNRVDSRLGVLATAPVTTSLGSGEAEQWLLAATLDVCLARTLGGGDMRMCAGPAVGALFAEGRGFDATRAIGVPWVAAVLRIDIRFALGAGVDLGVALSGLAPVVRPRLVVEGAPGAGEVAAEPLPPLGIVASLGPAFEF